MLELTEEQEERIRNFRPAPLAPETPEDHPALHPVVIDGKLGRYVSVAGKRLLNAASHNYLSMVGNEEVESAAILCLRKYGVGACGPRTFFGTVDVHLELERAISVFLSTEETAIYSLGLSTISSVIPAYVKQSDVLFVDEMANFPIQKGVQSSRCSVYWFKHNDVTDLLRHIRLDDEKHGVEALSTSVRRMVVVEGIYQRTGRLCPLPDVVAAAREHRLRVILDESVALGVLGRRGRGTTEHFDIPVSEIDIICGSMEHALGAYGGFSSGSHFVIDHQRLNGLGYVFSASLPPMLAAAALRSLELLDNDVTMTSRLSDVCARLHVALQYIPGLVLLADALSPLKYLVLKEQSDNRAKDEKLLHQIVKQVREEGGVLITVASCLADEQSAGQVLPSIRIIAAKHFTADDIQLISAAISRATRIMAILFCGVVMSHYTHYNLSPVTQITMQHTMRTVAFVAETCVFAYLGLAIFSFRHSVQMALVVWSLVLCLLGRALNIFPLSAIANYFRQHKITYKMQCIMWFSGLRGVIAYALCLHLEFETEKRHVLVTTTLIVVLSTILVLGGSTKPLLKFLRADRRENRSRRRRKNRRQRDLNMSKSLELGTAIDSEYLSELTEDEQRDSSSITHQLTGFSRLDCKYFIPFFRRRLTQQELRDARTQMTDLTNKVYQSIRVVPSDEEHDGEDERTMDNQRLIPSTNSI